MSVTFSNIETTSYETETCCTCAVKFAMTSEFRQYRLNNGGEFFCPNGHSQVYTKPKWKRLEEQLAAKEVELREQKCETLRQQQLVSVERGKVATVEKKLKRVANGVCPCCQRSFHNLKRHMATKHPETIKKK